MKKLNILYLDSFSRSKDDSEASDEIGYGPTSNLAIKKELRKLGHIVTDLDSLNIFVNSKLEWIHKSYEVIRTIPMESYDVVFIFHIFHHFPSEIKRILFDRGFRHIKLIGYTHGSHWDETDTFRETFYPGMKIADLANLSSLDGILIVSNYFKKLLFQRISDFNSELAKELESKMYVTGLPLNIELIDQYRTEKANYTQILFNHSPTTGKDPLSFFNAISEILSVYDISLLVTRRFKENSPGYNELQKLYQKYPRKVTLGNTMSHDEYFTALWKSQIQVSTALHESLGVSTLEAMYTYNCCILPNRQSYPEITGSTNLYNTVEELKSLIRYFIKNNDNREVVSRKMHEKSLHFMPEVVVQRISDAMITIVN